MPKMVRIVKFVLSCLLLSCASGPTIRVDADPSVNVRSYKTFNFLEPTSTDTGQYTTLISTRLKRSTRAQLEKYGYKYLKEGEPELVVNFYFKITNKTIYHTSGSGYYSYRYGTHMSHPYYVNSYDYREGTLAIDLVDAKKKQLVWRGIAEGEVDEDLAKKDPNRALDQLVTKIFSNFPDAPEQ